jgi:hypothetical protein
MLSFGCHVSSTFAWFRSKETSSVDFAFHVPEDESVLAAMSHRLEYGTRVPAKPIEKQDIHEFLEFLRSQRLYQITVRVVVVCAPHIMFSRRCRKYDDRYAFQFIRLFDSSQNLDSIDSRQVQIQQNYLRTRIECRITESIPAEEKVQCGSTVCKMEDLASNGMSLCGPDDELGMIGIIFDQHNKSRYVIDTSSFTAARANHDFPHPCLGWLFQRLKAFYFRQRIIPFLSAPLG